MGHTNIHTKGFKIEKEDSSLQYQNKLTQKLDNLKNNFDQNIINEIVLWKVNRFVELSTDTIEAINSIDTKAKVLNHEQTVKVLTLLLKTKGVRLPMASTILRFRNKYLYQIIDQRVYRIINNKDLKLFAGKNSIEKNIEMYLKYLDSLRSACDYVGTPFEESDRTLFMADKRVNKKNKIKY